MKKQESEGFLADLSHSKRIGRYKPFWLKNRLIGPDLWILASSFILIFIPSIFFVIFHMPLYENFWLMILITIGFLCSMTFDLYTLVDVGTSDSGIIPKSSHKINNKFKYYIDPKRAGFERIKLKVWKTCNIVRPPRSFHWRKWDAWIEVHDHHCPWTGTWIGRRTHRKFIKFLFATSSHGLVGMLCMSYPLWFVWDKPITNMLKFSGIILMLYAIGIMLLLSFFGVYHLRMAYQNITTNEKLRKAYKRRPNPYDFGSEQNWRLFVSEYPSTPSSVFDLYKSLMEDEEAFYHSILSRYGKLVWKRAKITNNENGKKDDDDEDENDSEDFIDYNNNGEIKMLLMEDHININSSENNA